MGHVDPFYIAMVNYHRVPTMWIIPRIATATTPTTPQQQQQTRRAVQRKRHLQASQQVRESKGTWKCGFHQGRTVESYQEQIPSNWNSVVEKKMPQWGLTQRLKGFFIKKSWRNHLQSKLSWMRQRINMANSRYWETHPDLQISSPLLFGDSS